MCTFVLQPLELQLPVALCFSLEEPASVLHDRGRGKINAIIIAVPVYMCYNYQLYQGVLAYPNGSQQVKAFLLDVAS